ncbi:MAG: ChaN family lipoprotein [Nanoarchaeota archaeon]|nr:ChaN family lipoprotein [Nanoarchaeota archaeon]MCG2718378.1 ChaN family lipoprotein [Nanoarchaeota archaeon]
MNLKKTVCSIAALGMLLGCTPKTFLKDWQDNIYYYSKEIGKNDLVYFGEEHGSKYIHDLQLEVFKELNKGKKFSVGLEMIQKNYQHVLDEYLTTDMDEDKLKKDLDWENTWGYDFNFFKPIFKYAKDKNLDIVALNAPREIVKKVARHGLESLVEEDYKYIPRKINLYDEEYENLKEIFKNHPGPGGDDFYRKMYQAQSIWNETMAATIVNYLKDGNRILVIAGDGHIGQRPAIPGRVEKRAKEEGIKLKTSIISVSNGDYLIILPEE